LSENPDHEKLRYFDVEKFHKIRAETSKRPGRVRRIFNRGSNVIDSMQGFFIVLMALPIMFGAFGAVIIGSYYGPLAFLGIMGSIIGGLALFVERKAGKSLQFGEYPFLKRTLAMPIAFLLALGFIYMLLSLSRFHGF
jgi:hypothetical protein